jgi:alpha-L-fucosidase
MKHSFIFILLLLAIVSSAQESQKYFPETDSLVLKKIEQWQDLKFGLLMHWGAYSQWGIVESWSICPEDYGWCERKKGNNPANYYEYVKEYENLKKTFNPVDFDPEKWAVAAKNAGMKYVVFTTKHHDGFSMFDSKFTDYKVTDKECPFHANPKANIAKEIFGAFRKEGMWTGAYFSKPDWHCPDYWDPYFPPLDRNVNYDPEVYPERWEKYVQFTHKQILELMTDYGKMDILWLDGGWVAKETPESINNWYIEQLEENKTGFVKHKIVNQDIRMDELVEKARKKQPGLIVVDRAVEGKNQNYLTPENTVPEEALPFPWESCIIAGGGWSWVDDATYKSSKELVHMLVDIVCKGGNLLLNIAPGPKGQWHDDAYLRLKDMGDWMKINGEAIYGTRAIAPYKESKICFTSKKKEGIVYAIYLADKDKSIIPKEIEIKSFKAVKNSKIFLLGTDKALKWQQKGEGILISVPESLAKNPPCKYAWTFKFKKG